MSKKIRRTFTVDSSLCEKMVIYGEKYKINWSQFVESALIPFVDSISKKEEKLSSKLSEQERLIRILGYVHSELTKR